MSKKKEPKCKEFPNSDKNPKSIKNSESYLNRNPVWAFHRCDDSHEKWSIKNCDTFYEEVIKKLISYEGMTWAEIQEASGGRKSGTNNHFENISEMIKEARDRATELKLDEDQLFSLRLDGKARLYGILEEGVFYILWLDRNHEIYPTEKQ